MTSKPAKKRLPRSTRRGSILIFVVGVLVLLAILATAFLTTSRDDRYAAQQNAYNTQIDLLLQGVINASQVQITGDESIPTTTVGVTYEPTDAITYTPSLLNPGLLVLNPTNDNWLASRVPTTTNHFAVFSPGANFPVWPAISAPVLGDYFETPFRPTAGAYAGSLQYSNRFNVIPASINLNGRDYPAFRVDTQQAPTSNTNAPTRFQNFLAGDADGDGIADSGLVKMPIGELAGVTYYAAVRIIDNSSAINVDTALSRNADFDGLGNAMTVANASKPGAFVSGVGILEMLRTFDPAATAPEFTPLSPEFARLNNLRMNLGGALPDGVRGNTAQPSPVDDVIGLQRPDFEYASIGEALASTLGQRVGNPGVSVFTGIRRTRPAFTDSLSLASRFSILNGYGESTPLETALNESTRFYPPSTAFGFPLTSQQLTSQPYAASAVNNWFAQHFDYRNESSAFPSVANAFGMNRRTILTADNAVSSIAPPQRLLPPAFFYDQAALAMAVPSHDVRLYQEDTTAPYRAPVYIPTLPTVGQPAIDAKISINTARYEELAFGFFKVMARPGFSGVGDGVGTPYTTFETLTTTGIPTAADTFYGKAITARGNSANASPYYSDPYVGMKFTAETFAKGVETNPSLVNGQNTAEPEQHPLRMFRSPLRAPHNRNGTAPFWTNTTPRLPADQVLLLRATIAAANAEALRDNDDRITPHNVPLVAQVGNVFTSVIAHVFGLERQPYITEVYVNTDHLDATLGPANPRGYVAVKLFNPYPFPISLQNCRLVGLRRHIDTTTVTTPVTTQYPNMEVLDLPAVLPAAPATTVDQISLGTAVSNVNGAPYAPWIVPAGGTLVLENIPGTPPAVILTDDAGHRPASTGITPAIGLITLPVLPAPAIAPLNYAYVPGLQRVVYDRELVLVRPLGATRVDPGNLTTPLVYTDDQPAIATNDKVSMMAPLDSFDFSGLQVADGSLPTTIRAQAWHYVRTTDATWKFVYPGRYDANQSILVAATDLPRPRQEGVDEAYSNDPADLGRGWVPGMEGGDPWTPDPANPPPVRPAPTITLNGNTGTARYLDQFTIQLNANDWPSINPLVDHTVSGRNRFPFGGFVRLGDLLDVPFIGSYTIQTEANATSPDDFNFIAGKKVTVLEMNSVTSDAAFAEDTDPFDNPTVGAPVAAEVLRSREQIGRFAPLRPSHGNAVGAKVNGDAADLAAVADPAGGPDFVTYEANGGWVGDVHRYSDDMVDAERIAFLGATPAAGAPTTDNERRLNRYAWAKTLFDVFTTHAPHDDYVTNYPTQPKMQVGVQYLTGDAIQYGNNVYICRANRVIPSDPPPPNEFPTLPQSPTANWTILPRGMLANAGTSAGSRSDLAAGGRSTLYNVANDTNEAPSGTQGLININTAPEKVLAMVPWLPPGDNYTIDTTVYPTTVTLGGDTIIDNDQVARAIVQYRDGNYVNVGNPSPRFARAIQPFRTIYDLYRVPVIMAVQNVLLAARDPFVNDGDASPLNVADGIRGDFEEQFLMMNRVSNVLSVRSDTFTAYVLVQGWRNVGTTSPELVVERRGAYILDRSGMKDQKEAANYSKVPVQ